MTIEQRCNLILKNYKYPYPEYTIENWVWNKEKQPLSLLVDHFGGDQLNNEIAIFKIDKYIYESDECECLTSNSEYIRKCKQWMLKNDYGKKINELMATLGKPLAFKKSSCLRKILNWIGF